MSKQTDLVEIAQDGIVVPDASVSEARLQVSNDPTDGYMLTAQSGNTGGLTWAEAPSSSTTAGAVGTYAFLWRDDAGTTLGTTHAGSTLFYAIINDDNTSGAVANVYHGNGTVRSGISPSGTWRAMGSAGSYSAAYGQATVYVRIS